jgi:hypothetical protein
MTHPALSSIIGCMDDPALYEPWFRGETWNGWKAILRAAFALPMTDEEEAFFTTVAERDPPSSAPAKELWISAGRRSGKDSIASVLAAHLAATFNDGHLLRPGERALVMCLATDRDQAKIVLNYTRAFFDSIDMLRGMVVRETANGFELDNQVDIAVVTNSFRAVRGRPILAAIFDEVAFWRDENSATPDEETYRALRPGMASLPSSVLIGISSPYRKAGLLYRKFREHYGKPSDDVLVIKAATRQLNPTIDRAIVDKALADDPQAAKGEWMGEFRDDIAAFVTQEAVDLCVSPGVLERPRVTGEKYSAFCDPSGGVSDAMTLAVAHSEKSAERTVAMLDVVREIRAPFAPDDAVREFVVVLRSYGIRSVRGDRYGAEWVRDAFAKHGIEYRPADLSKSDVYRNFLPRLNSGEVDLLDNKRLIAQLLGLERRTARGGRDSIDHAPGAHDDVCNAACGVLVYQTSARHAGPPMPVFGIYGTVTRQRAPTRLETEMRAAIPPCTIRFNEAPTGGQND